MGGVLAKAGAQLDSVSLQVAESGNITLAFRRGGSATRTYRTHTNYIGTLLKS